MKLPKGNTAAYLIAIAIGAACLYFGLHAGLTKKTALPVLFGAVMVLGGIFGLIDLLKKRRKTAGQPDGKEETPHE